MQTLLVALIVLCVIGALVARTVWLRRQSFEAQLAADLRRYGLTLIHSRPPPLLRSSPFRGGTVSLDLGEVATDYSDSYSATRKATVRALDGLEHEVWARLDLDTARPRVGLDEVQIEWSPALNTLGKR